jgi:nucleotide-binding universal stress UspA family protein
MFDYIIIGVAGPQAGRDALGLARQLASPHAQLTLACVEVVPPRPWPRSGAVTEAAHASRALERVASLRDESKVDAQVVCVEATSVATGLHEFAARHEGDLLVIGASRRDEHERIFVGNDTRAVLENSPCAVAVAPVGYATRPPLLRRIGAAYDGSRESEQALAVARRLTRERGAELSAFEAVPEPVHYQNFVYPQPEIEAGLAEARKRIAELGDVEPDVASSDDDAEALARYGASVDLLILGSHKYRPIDQLLSGSTAQRLADKAPCPLLVLPRDHAERVAPAHPTLSHGDAVHRTAEDNPDG